MQHKHFQIQPFTNCGGTQGGRFSPCITVCTPCLSSLPPAHGLRTPREEIALTAWPKIQSQSQIFQYGRSIFCLPHQPNFSDIFDLFLHWVSVVRGNVDEQYIIYYALNIPKKLHSFHSVTKVIQLEYLYFGPYFAFIINNYTYLEKVTYWIKPSKFIVFDWQTHICLNCVCYHWVYYAFKSKVSDIAYQKHTSPSFIHHSIYCINKKRIGLCPGIFCCRLKREN